MAISDAMNAKLNEQVTHEFNASHIYLSMACQFESMSLSMLAKMFRKQAEEERGHALKIVDYLLDNEGTVKLDAIPQPPTQWKTVLAAVESALEHERKVTAQINALAAHADQEKDYATRSMLNWFIDEQVEEVNSMAKLRDVVKMAGDRLLQLEAYVAQVAKD